ncbi:hypothetical protein PP175_07885 [Aneurinibacillus sp. Ricciae_BoGa-3]|uniref:DUF6884 domain-containing protein n=1 Tax=Aneurinibacillus sp. Ricciae_BoGa-3 TaxID=3022697 RepID=UPI002340778B|nr:DUF6884 domain-containing protein [Aneurinibacillus sp. Ricciae_BoGa-3]WCK55835.1 hypothetical protein PP175_07885 [Aneurinibacillus sp. Ricciae_BoGa-3]
MNRLCIIPCGTAKIWDKNPLQGPTEAKNAYIGPYGRACQAYADRFFTDWVILSAKHGFLFPTDPVPENYNVSFSMNHPDVISVQELKRQVDEKQLSGFDEIVVVAGKKYKRVIEQVFGDGYVYRYPLQGCKGIGYMLQKLKNAVQTSEEIGQSVS